MNCTFCTTYCTFCTTYCRPAVFTRVSGIAAAQACSRVKCVLCGSASTDVPDFALLPPPPLDAGVSTDISLIFVLTRQNCGLSWPIFLRLSRTFIQKPSKIFDHKFSSEISPGPGARSWYRGLLSTPPACFQATFEYSWRLPAGNCFVFCTTTRY